MRNSNYNLNVFRFLYCLVLSASVPLEILPYNERLLPVILAAPSELWLGFPIDFFEFLSRDAFGLGFTGLQMWGALLFVLLLLSAFAVLGRAPLFFAWILYFSVQFPFSQNFDLYANNILFFSMGVLVCSKKAFSISIFRPHSLNGEDTTQDRLILVLLMSLIPIVFFNAFISKMLGGVEGWLTGKSLQAFFHIAYVAKGNEWALSVARNDLLCQILSCSALAFEALAPLLFMLRRTRPIVVIVALLFHLVIYLTMHINFLLPFAPLYLVYVNFSSLVRARRE